MLHVRSLTADQLRCAVEHTVHRLEILQFYHSRGSLVVKVMDSWLACNEFQPSDAEDSPCWGSMLVKSVEAHTSSIGKVWKCRPRHLTMVQNYEDRHR
ncbi:hypothetical protein TNCV_1438151 [Trichonephila clavipes]|nr:hypothetical protein TNCV_1438151 [Trichonephila clavipes]